MCIHFIPKNIYVDICAIFMSLLQMLLIIAKVLSQDSRLDNEINCRHASLTIPFVISSIDL